MQAAVDLTNLRELTGGDVALERELFADFLRAGDEFLCTMRASVDPAHQESWRRTAHAFKGIALNIGADPLGELCKQAQDKHAEGESVKILLVEQVNGQYQQVKAYLQSL